MRRFAAIEAPIFMCHHGAISFLHCPATDSPLPRASLFECSSTKNWHVCVTSLKLLAGVEKPPGRAVFAWSRALIWCSLRANGRAAPLEPAIANSSSLQCLFGRASRLKHLKETREGGRRRGRERLAVREKLSLFSRLLSPIRAAPRGERSHSDNRTSEEETERGSPHVSFPLSVPQQVWQLQNTGTL